MDSFILLYWPHVHLHRFYKGNENGFQNKHYVAVRERALLQCHNSAEYYVEIVFRSAVGAAHEHHNTVSVL